jgi:hypothetical protein
MRSRVPAARPGTGTISNAIPNTNTIPDPILSATARPLRSRTRIAAATAIRLSDMVKALPRPHLPATPRRTVTA